MTYRDIVLARWLVLAACMAAVAPAAVYAQSPSEDQLLGVLASQADAAAKCNACRDLRLVGTEKSVPALAALLTDPQISHAARIGLEAMPYPSAGEALRDAAGKTSGATKSGVLDGLGERRDPQAVPLASAALEDGDPMVVAAAATALGKIGASDAVKALAAARPTAQGDAAVKIAAAMIACADRLLRDGKTGEAVAIYRELSQPGVDRTARAAALRGLIESAGPEAAARITEALASDDPLVLVAAAACLPRLSATDLRTVSADMSKLPVASQVSVLAAMRISGDRSFAPLALAATKNQDQTARLAAVCALAR